MPPQNANPTQTTEQFIQEDQNRMYDRVQYKGKVYPIPKGLDDKAAKAYILKTYPDVVSGKQTHPGPYGGAGLDDWDAVGPPIGLGKGFLQGLNPFHQTPEGAVSPNMNQYEGAAESILNAPEIANRLSHGDVKGGLGMAAGTIASFLGPEEIKAAGKAIEGTRIGEALSMADRSAAVIRARGGRVGVNQNLINAEKVIQPIRNWLDTKEFGPVHKALAKDVIPLDRSVEQNVRRIAETEPDVKKYISRLYREEGVSRDISNTGKSVEKTKTTRLGPGSKQVSRASQGARSTQAMRQPILKTRSALDYEEARKIVANLRQHQHESPQLEAIADSIDRSIDKAAALHSPEIAAQRQRAQMYYKKMMDIRNAALDTKESGLSQVAGAIPKVGRLVPSGKRVDPQVIQAAQELLNELKGKSKLAQRAGSVMKKAGTAADVANVAGRGSKGVLDSFQSGTDYVPQTGTYQLHKGEAVVPAHQNPSNNMSIAGHPLLAQHGLINSLLNVLRMAGQNVGRQYSSNTNEDVGAPQVRTSPTTEQAMQLFRQFGDINSAAGMSGVRAPQPIAKPKHPVTGIDVMPMPGSPLGPAPISPTPQPRDQRMI